MQKLTNRIALAALCCWLLPCSVSAARLLVPGGQIVGLELHSGAVTVAAFDDQLGKQTKESGLQIGDEILEIDGKQIEDPEDVHTALETSDGNVEILVDRDGKEKTVTVEPQITKEGPRLGIYLRRGITGVGTVTWYDPETGKFGTLGHGVNDGKGNMLEMTEGVVWPASVVAVEKGRPGKPGQLRGAIQGESSIGSLSGNTTRGVFGESTRGWSGEALPVAEYEDICTGSATILSTVNGDTVQEYSVEIMKIYPESRADGRNMLLKVTDPELLDVTGGIVQGMSGSPIIQDGKLVGAVTHVLVNDPSTGYGIFIENMLEAAG